jgi:hypothetical protein
MPLFGKEKVSLGGSRQIGDTISSIEQGRTLVFRQCGVRLDLQGFVMSEMTIEGAS